MEERLLPVSVAKSFQHSAGLLEELLRVLLLLSHVMYVSASADQYLSRG